jgi:hypothetical protein
MVLRSNRGGSQSANIWGWRARGEIEHWIGGEDMNPNRQLINRGDKGEMNERNTFTKTFP